MKVLTISDLIIIGCTCLVAILGVVEKSQKIKWKPISDIFKDKELHTKLDNIEQTQVEIQKDNILMKDGVCNLQRNSLVKSCKEYLKRKKATFEEKETIKELYESYHKLGGDSFITEMVRQVMNLPLEEERR